MSSILVSLLAIVAAVTLAIVIIRFLPLKMRWIVSIFLLALSVFLVYEIYQGIMKPIRFNIEKKVRYAKVIKNLKIIRDAEVDYHKVMGRYTKDKQALLKFIDTAKMAITETKNIKVTVNTGGGITKEVSKKKVDTIGYEPVLKRFDDIDYKNMFSVPGTDKEFELATSAIEKVPGLMVGVFEAKIDKASILKGMDPSLVKQEEQTKDSDQVKGKFISVGSLEEVSTGGNWPPYYDKNQIAKKDDK